MLENEEFVKMMEIVQKLSEEAEEELELDEEKDFGNTEYKFKFD